MDETTKLYRVRKTAFEMLRDRGFAIIETEYAKTFEQFKTDYEFGGKVDRQRMNISAINENNPEEKILVAFHDDDLKQSHIQTYTQMAEKDSMSNVIIVVGGACSSTVKKTIESTSDVDRQIRWEIMFEDDLIINVTKHILVPEHIKLTKEEGLELLKKYQVKQTQLPRMLVDDPISKYYGFRRGDIVKIIRKSETAGRYVTYRAVF